MQQPKKPAPTPRQVYSYQQPRPLPFQPAPKPSTARAYTDAELAGYARRIVALDTEIAHLMAKVNELRRQEVQTIAEMRQGMTPGIIEVCSNCGIAHEGPC